MTGRELERMYLRVIDGIYVRHFGLCRNGGLGPEVAAELALLEALEAAGRLLAWLERWRMFTPGVADPWPTAVVPVSLRSRPAEPDEGPAS